MISSYDKYIFALSVPYGSKERIVKIKRSIRWRPSIEDIAGDK